MKSRFLAATAVLLLVCTAAVVTSGCSSNSLPAPTVNGVAVEASAAAAAAAASVRGIDTTLTVAGLVKKLKAAGLTVTRPGSTSAGVFIPAAFEPVIADKASIQTYRFVSSGEASAAASTVDTDGAVLAATPNDLVQVNWTGSPAFFRSGYLIVIFVSEKPATKNLARDTKVFNALKKIMGKPFAGTFGDSPAATSTATPQ